MTTRGSQALTWDLENPPEADGETILYVNKYYEKNLTTGVVTTYYFLGDRLVFNVRQLASLGRPLKPGKRGRKPRHARN